MPAVLPSTFLPVRPAATLLLVLGWGALCLPGPAAAQEAEDPEPFRFEDIEWSADRNTVRRALANRGYDPVDDVDGALVFVGRFLDRPARGRASFSEGGSLEKVVVRLSEELTDDRAKAFVEGLRSGIEYRRGPPCDLTSGDETAAFTWRTGTHGRSSALRVKAEDGTVSFLYLGPGADSDGVC